MKIVFFGVGAVCSVISRVIFDLNKKNSKEDLEFLFIVRDKIKAKKQFFKNKEILEISDFLKVPRFEDIFSNKQN